MINKIKHVYLFSFKRCSFRSIIHASIYKQNHVTTAAEKSGQLGPFRMLISHAVYCVVLTVFGDFVWWMIADVLAVLFGGNNSLGELWPNYVYR